MQCKAKYCELIKSGWNIVSSHFLKGRKVDMEMEEKIESWCTQFSFEKANIVGYRGGYPIVEFTLKDNQIEKIPKQRVLDSYVRKAEMRAGAELGVGLNFRRTASANQYDNKLVICGYITIIEKVLHAICD